MSLVTFNERLIQLLKELYLLYVNNIDSANNEEINKLSLVIYRHIPNIKNPCIESLRKKVYRIFTLMPDLYLENNNSYLRKIYRLYMGLILTDFILDPSEEDDKLIKEVKKRSNKRHRVLICVVDGKNKEFQFITAKKLENYIKDYNNIPFDGNKLVSIFIEVHNEWSHCEKKTYNHPCLFLSKYFK